MTDNFQFMRACISKAQNLWRTFPFPVHHRHSVYDSLSRFFSFRHRRRCVSLRPPTRMTYEDYSHFFCVPCIESIHSVICAQCTHSYIRSVPKIMHEIVSLRANESLMPSKVCRCNGETNVAADDENEDNDYSDVMVSLNCEFLTPSCRFNSTSTEQLHHQLTQTTLYE